MNRKGNPSVGGLAIAKEINADIADLRPGCGAGAAQRTATQRENKT